MNRFLVLSLAGVTPLLGAAESLAQTPNVTLYGRILNGDPYVDIQRADQSFYAFGSRNLGPQREGQKFNFGGYELKPNAELQAFIDSVVRDLRQVLPAEQRQSTPVSDITHTPPISLGGIANMGDRTFLTTNERRADLTWEARVYAIDNGSTSGSPPSVKATLNLTKPGEAEDVSDFLVRVDNPIRYDTPTISGLTGFAATGRRESNECFAPVLKKFEYLRDQESLTLSYGFEFAKDFPGCHLGGSTNIRAAAAWVRTETAYDRLHIGVRGRPTAAGPEEARLYQVRDKGTTASLDPDFGDDGQVIIKAADGVTPLRYWDHAIDSRGRWVVSYGLGLSAGSFLPAVLRLNANGTLDTSFASGGVQVIPTTGTSTNPRTITSDINDSIQVSGETYTATTVRPFVYFHTKTSLPVAPETYDSQLREYTFAGHENSAFFTHGRDPDGTIIAAGTSYGAYPDMRSMRPLLVALEGPKAAMPAIEYFHGGFGHHATIANPVEIDKLDKGEISGWNRTGWWFNVYPVGTPGTTAVDRFFSEAFAPKSSHVYTADAAESAIVKQNPNWKFEGTVFGVLVPSATGRCSPSARPVSRIYNDGKTGAPNHRFADAVDAIAEALAAGGLLEGTVFCTE